MNGDLAFKGPLVSAPTLSGTVNLARTVITVPERLPGSLAALDVKHKNASAAVRAQQQALAPASQSSGGTGALTLDLTVNANNQIFVTRPRPRRRTRRQPPAYRLDRGAAGDRPVHAEARAAVDPRQAADLHARHHQLLRVAGAQSRPLGGFDCRQHHGDRHRNRPRQQPEIRFTSVPALPEDEVLARLIFGRSMSNLSPLQIAQLAEAAAQLAGVRRLDLASRNTAQQPRRRRS